MFTVFVKATFLCCLVDLAPNVAVEFQQLNISFQSLLKSIKNKHSKVVWHSVAD